MSFSIMLVIAILVIFILFSFYKKISPNKILVRYGMGGTKLATHGGLIVIPFFQSSKFMSLSPINLNINLSDGNLLSEDKIKTALEADATISVSADESERAIAATALLDKSEDQIAALAEEILTGTTRAIVARMKFEDLIGNRDKLLANVKIDAEAELSKFGLDLRNFNFKKIIDLDGIMIQLGKGAAATAKATAEIKTSQMEKESAIRTTENHTEKDISVAEQENFKQIAISDANAKRAEAEEGFRLRQVIAEQESRAKQRVVEIEAEKNKAQAEITTSRELEIQEQERQQAVLESSKATAIKNKELEIIRRQQEELVPIQINAEKEIVIKRNEVEKKQIEADAQLEIVEKTSKALLINAEAQKKAAILEAEGEAARIATPILEKAKAEAEALKIYGQEGMIQLKMIEILPLLAKMQVDALASFKVDSINIVSNGNGDTAGAAGNEIARTATNIMNSIPMIKMVNDTYEKLGITNITGAHANSCCTEANVASHTAPAATTPSN